MKETSLSLNNSKENKSGDMAVCIEHDDRYIDENGTRFYKTENVVENKIADNITFKYYKTPENEIMFLQHEHGKYYDISGNETELPAGSTPLIQKNADMRNFYDMVYQKSWEEYRATKKPSEIKRNHLDESYYDYISRKENEGKKNAEQVKLNKEDKRHQRAAGRYPKLMKQMIIQLGNYDNPINEKDAKNILIETLRNFEKNNPGVRIVNAAIHMDETPNKDGIVRPHLHLTYAFAVPKHYKNGVECLVNSQTEAMKLNGLKDKKINRTDANGEISYQKDKNNIPLLDENGNKKPIQKVYNATTQWQDKNREIVKEIAEKYGYKIINQGIHREHDENDVYKRIAMAAEKELADKNQIIREKDNIIAGKDKAIRERNNIIADKNQELDNLKNKAKYFIFEPEKEFEKLQEQGEIKKSFLHKNEYIFSNNAFETMKNCFIYCKNLIFDREKKVIKREAALDKREAALNKREAALDEKEELRRTEPKTKENLFESIIDNIKHTLSLKLDHDEINVFDELKRTDNERKKVDNLYINHQKKSFKKDDIER